MNITSTKTQTCQNCGNTFDWLIFHNVNVTNDPEFKRMIFEDTFFKLKCPHCKKQFEKLHPILYHDMVQKYMLYFLPDPYYLSNSDLHEKFSDITDISKRIVYTLNDLKEKILIFDSGLSDFAINILKILILEKNLIKHSSYHLHLTAIKNNNFSFTLSHNQQTKNINIPAEEYKIAVDIVGKDTFVDKNIFSSVTINSAKKFLNNYKTLRIS